jgi:hypothetical protein
MLRTHAFVVTFVTWLGGGVRMARPPGGAKPPGVPILGPRVTTAVGAAREASVVVWNSTCTPGSSRDPVRRPAPCRRGRGTTDFLATPNRPSGQLHSIPRARPKNEWEFRATARSWTQQSARQGRDRSQSKWRRRRRGPQAGRDGLQGVSQPVALSLRANGSLCSSRGRVLGGGFDPISSSSLRLRRGEFRPVGRTASGLAERKALPAGARAGVGINQRR